MPTCSYHKEFAHVFNMVSHLPYQSVFWALTVNIFRVKCYYDIAAVGFDGKKDGVWDRFGDEDKARSLRSEKI